jgi:hypothetical protein
MRAHVVHWLESAAPTSLADTSTIEDIDRLEQLALLGYTDEGSAVEGALFDPECGCDRCAAYD